jgi:CDP-diglyceride synthetase
MGKNPINGMVIGACGVVLVGFLMVTQPEMPSPGYAALIYVLLASGVLTFIGSLVTYLKGKK